MLLLWNSVQTYKQDQDHPKVYNGSLNIENQVTITHKGSSSCRIVFDLKNRE